MATQIRSHGLAETSGTSGTSSDRASGAVDPEVQRRVDEVNLEIRLAEERLPWTGVAPVAKVQWIHIDRVQANDYNPNSVAHHEMRLLHTSIKEDGYTQPVVSIVEPRVGIVLPCRHFSTLDQSLASFLIPRFLGTPPGFSMGKEAFLPLSDSPIGIPGGVSKSASPKATTAKTSANGSGISGESATSTSNVDSALPTSGTSRASEMSVTSWTHVCPICESSDRGRRKSWSASTVSLEVDGEEGGLTLSWLSSGTTASEASESSQKPSGEALKPSATSAVVRDISKAIIVDGFHRYTTMRRYQDIYDSTQGYLPVVVLEKDIADRMASTVRHNRARGRHSIGGMGNMVFALLTEGKTDTEICDSLGMEAEELARLKHITGYSKLYDKVPYSQPVLTTSQLKAKAGYKKEHPDEHVPSDI